MLLLAWYTLQGGGSSRQSELKEILTFFTVTVSPGVFCKHKPLVFWFPNKKFLFITRVLNVSIVTTVCDSSRYGCCRVDSSLWFLFDREWMSVISQRLQLSNVQFAFTKRRERNQKGCHILCCSCFIGSSIFWAAPVWGAAGLEVPGQ